MKKLVTPVLVTSLFAAVTWITFEAAAKNTSYSKIPDTSICVPDEYAVELPSAGDTADSEQYDVSDGYEISIQIDRSEVSQNIENYKEKINIGGDTRYQGLYLSLYPAGQKSLKVTNPGSLTKIKAAGDLFIQDFDSTPLAILDVLEKDGDTYTRWGHCTQSSWNGAPKRLECDRYYLRSGPLRIAYEIDEANLHLHDTVDRFVQEKLNQWECD